MKVIITDDDLERHKIEGLRNINLQSFLEFEQFFTRVDSIVYKGRSGEVILKNRNGIIGMLSNKPNNFLL